MNDSGEIYIGYPVRTLYSEYLLSLGRDASLLLCTCDVITVGRFTRKDTNRTGR
jgi:hypothetical protein